MLRALKTIQPEELDPSPAFPQKYHKYIKGHGANAVVFVAKYNHHDVAVKLLSGGFKSIRDFVNFRNEARMMDGVQHDNIVRVYGVVMDASIPCLVMEYYENGSLEEVLPRMSLPQKLYALSGVVCGLAYVHKHLVARRDLKTANILLDDAGKAVIGDFGSVKILGESTGQTKSTVVGTTEYMAPEVARGQCAGVAWLKADIWSFGVVCVKVLTGSLLYHSTGLFGDGLLVHIAGLKRKPDIPPLPAGTPNEVAKLVAQCLEIEPKDRPTADQLIAAFQHVPKAVLSPTASVDRLSIDSAIEEERKKHAEQLRVVREQEQERARQEAAKEKAELEEQIRQLKLQGEQQKEAVPSPAAAVVAPNTAVVAQTKPAASAVPKPGLFVCLPDCCLFRWWSNCSVSAAVQSERKQVSLCVGVMCCCFEFQLLIWWVRGLSSSKAVMSIVPVSLAASF